MCGEATSHDEPPIRNVVGGTVGAHAEPHHHGAGAAHDEHTKCSIANKAITEPTTTVRTAHMLIGPPQHTIHGLGNLLLSWLVVHANIPTTTLHRVFYVIERHQHQMSIPRLLLMGRTSYETEHMAQSRGTETCVVAVMATW